MKKRATPVLPTITVVDAHQPWVSSLEALFESHSASLGVQVEKVRRAAEASGDICISDQPVPGHPAVWQVVQEGERQDRDSVLVHPFRLSEIRTRLSAYRDRKQLDAFRSLGGSFNQVIEKLKSDLELVERVHRRKIPKRFPKVKGLQVASRFLAGAAPGGDHFDLAETRASSRVSFLMTDSSSYGLAGAILDVIMSVAMKLGMDELRTSEIFVRQIYDEVMLALGKKDHLSVFYGLYSRASSDFEYVSVGSNRGFYAPAGKPFQELPRIESPIPQAAADDIRSCGKVSLAPNDRIVLLSDGFLESFGGEKSLESWINGHRGTEPDKFLTELAFQVKSKLSSDDDLPDQDCSALLIDVDTNVTSLRATK